MTHPELTQQQIDLFVASDGEQCPRCGSNDVDYGPLRAVDDEVTQVGRCPDCNGHWLIGFEVKLSGVVLLPDSENEFEYESEEDE